MPTGQAIKEEIDLEMLMDRALEKAGYHGKRAEFERTNRQGGNRRRGIGLSCFFHGSGFTGSGEVRLASEIALRLTREGGIEVLAANVEYGQGTNTTFAQIVAETCRIAPDWVEIHQPDTAEVPDSGPTVASRTTMIVGKLVERAAEQIRDRLLDQGYVLKDYAAADFRHGARRYLEENSELKVTVRYVPPADVHWDEATYRGDAYGGYSWSCDVAEVEVNQVDYMAQVTNFVSVVECGRVINPVLAAGQIEGGIVQGIGFAIYEDVVLERGAMKNTQYTNYIIPTTADTPGIDVEFVEFPYANYGPYQAKGIGEMPIDGPAPAVAAAVAHALGGNFINEIPLTPERIMTAVAGAEVQRR
jgi:CO/xanthine dehydrogenase Mo-binding subunit